MNAAGDALRSALLTPVGRGAVAVVGLCGPGAAAIVARHFQPATGTAAELPRGRIRFGRWHAALDDAHDVGEELVVCRRGDDDFEIHCHGGAAASAAILAGLRADGAAIIPWTEWNATRGDAPIACEAREALARARTTRTAAVLVDQLGGALRRALDEATRLLESGDVGTARSRIDGLLARSTIGLRLTEPFRVVLTGRPNVGKSSLINALVGYRRAVVFDEPGTTRDVVTAAAVLDGWPVELSDTAGIREAGDELEAAGIAAARRRLAKADLVVAVFDRSAPWCDADAALLAAHPEAVVVHNKADLPEIVERTRPPGLIVSAVAKTGIDELIAEIVARLVPNPPKPGDAVPFTRRQVEELQLLTRSVSEDPTEPR
jgi:tRNA modification GTPase